MKIENFEQLVPKPVAIPALGLLGLSLSYEMMEGLLLFKF